MRRHACWVRGTIVLSLGICLVASNVYADGDISFTVAPAKGGYFTFGAIQSASFTIRNLSDRAMVVEDIRMVTGTGWQVAGISRTIYGGFEKKKDADGYEYDHMDQTESDLAAHAGFLLPDEQVTVVTKFRPVALEEEFEIEYSSAGSRYEGTGEPFTPFQVYIPAEPADGSSESTQSPWCGADTHFVPFTVSRWKEVAAEHPWTYPLRGGCSARAVLIPGLKAESRRVTFNIGMEYEGLVFSLEEAQEAAGRISGTGRENLELTYCTTFGGYVVHDNDGAWILASSNQKEGGEVLPSIPATFPYDVDSSELVRVRVGDEQKGMGPRPREAPGLFWDRYPKYYGDGMYTDGEFLHLGGKDVMPFLQEARARGYDVGARGYFFGLRYYTLIPRQSSGGE